MSSHGRDVAANFLGPPILLRLDVHETAANLLLPPSPTLAEKDMEIGRPWLGSKLAHHQRYLAAMIGGMIRYMLHQFSQAEQGIPCG